MKIFDSIGVHIPPVLLPKSEIDLHKWSVIACDQFTSEPEYWHAVEDLVGDAPSTLNLIIPEVYLEGDDVPERIKKVQASMTEYLANDIFDAYENLILVERTVDGKTRRGLVLALDLERYDYNKGSQSLIRATEGTIIDRLPPRMRVREGAKLELPHILVLIDDPEKTVIEPLAAAADKLKKVYDFDLMQGSGHLTGYAVTDTSLEAQAAASLGKLMSPEVFAPKYGVDAETSPLLFAMGDGNHSLATAKAIWEQVKGEVGMDSPLRYALVEIENIHDPALEFEPIHRVLFGLQADISAEAAKYYGDTFRMEKVSSKDEMIQRVEGQKGPEHLIGFVQDGKHYLWSITQPSHNLPVGTLQAFLDGYMQADGAEKIDYVHGADVTIELGSKPGNAGFYLPPMAKSDLFKTVILDGALPRKTFSMGEAHEKRFYLEAHQIN